MDNLKLNSDNLRSLLKKMAADKATSHLITIINFEKRALLAEEHKPVQGIYFILEGKVKIFNTEKNNKTKIFRLAAKGDLVGFSSLNSTNYWSSAVALDKVKAYFININSLKLILKNNSKLSLLFINALALNLQNYEMRQRYVNLFPASIRIIEVLLHIAHKFGIKTAEGIELTDCVSRKEIASFANTSTEKAIRTISLLKSKSYIALDNKKIIITDKNALIEQLKKYCCDSKINLNEATCYLNLFY